VYVKIERGKARRSLSSGKLGGWGEGTRRTAYLKLYCFKIKNSNWLTSKSYGLEPGCFVPVIVTKVLTKSKFLVPFLLPFLVSLVLFFFLHPIYEYNNPLQRRRGIDWFEVFFFNTK